MVTKYGLKIKNLTISWVMIAGLILSTFSLAWAQKFSADSDNKYSSKDIATIGNNNSNLLETEINGQNSNSPNINTNTKSASKNSNTQNTAANSPANSGGSSGQNGATGTNPASPIYLVALGDSITYGSGLGTSYSYATGTSINSVGLNLINSGKITNSKNISVPGAKSADVLSSQVPQISAYNPSYITLLIGGNDMLSLLSGNPVTPEQFQANLSSIASSMIAPGRKVLIGTIPDYSVIWQAGYPSCNAYSYDPALIAYAIGLYNNKISAIANQYGLTLVNLYPYLGTGDVLESDCIHPNALGQQKIANQFIGGL